MPDDNNDNRESFLARSVQSLQGNVRTAQPAALASYTLIGAIIVLGGLGFALDRWLGTTPWLLLGGLLLGLIVGFYELAKAVFRHQ
jgi:F0F1-type ATP synthase assembly protein I